eukprot:365334-Chlamydomonas_euryale.AAC.1
MCLPAQCLLFPPAYPKTLAPPVGLPSTAAGGTAHVLDVGCGTGALSLMAAKAGADGVVGVDVHPGALAAARTNAALSRVAEKVRFRGGCE